jgi:hypothetical protein
MKTTDRINNSYLMTKLAVGNYATGLTPTTATSQPSAQEPRVPNIFGKTKIERGESPRVPDRWNGETGMQGKNYKSMDQVLQESAQPVAPRNLAGKTPAARGDAPRIPNAQVINPDNMDDIIQQAREPDPRYVQRMMSQGKDPVVPANATYAVNPTLGNTGGAARAIPVAPAAAAPTVDPNLAARLFQKTTGTAYNDKAKGDQAMMQRIQERLKGMGGNLGGMSDNQFALKMYGRK